MILFLHFLLIHQVKQVYLEVLRWYLVIVTLLEPVVILFLHFFLRHQANQVYLEALRWHLFIVTLPEPVEDGMLYFFAMQHRGIEFIAAHFGSYKHIYYKD